MASFRFALGRTSVSRSPSRSFLFRRRPNTFSGAGGSSHSQSSGEDNGGFKYTNVQKNPFLLSGPRQSCNMTVKNDGLYMRVDMPGIAKEEVKVWAENGSVVLFKGYGSVGFDHNDSVRNYGGRISLKVGAFNAEQLRFEMKNGVLRFFIPWA